MPVLNETGGLDATIQLHDGTIITRAELFEEVKHFVRGEALAKVKGFEGAKWNQVNWFVANAEDIGPDQHYRYVPRVGENLCGTGMCVAGWTCVAEVGVKNVISDSVPGSLAYAAGWDDRRLFVEDEGVFWDEGATWDYSHKGLSQTMLSGSTVMVEGSDGEDRRVSMQARAQELLGLDHIEAEMLFSGANEAPDIERKLDAFAQRMHENAEG